MAYPLDTGARMSTVPSRLGSLMGLVVSLPGTPCCQTRGSMACRSWCRAWLLAAFYDAAVGKGGSRIRAIGGQAASDGGALRFAVRASQAGDQQRLEVLARLGVV